MQIFKLRQDGFKDIRKKMLIRVLPIVLIALVGGILISFINSKDVSANISALPFIIPFIALAGGLGLYRAVNRQKALFDSYTLTITNNLITRELLNTPTISIYFTEIKQIKKDKNGTLAIQGKDRADVIYIPSQIDNHAELETILQHIQPILENEKVPFLQKYQSLTILITVGLMLGVYTVNNKIVVAITGTALITLMLWSLIYLQRNKNVDNKTKRGLWWILLVLASVIGVMVFKLTGLADPPTH